MKKEKGKKSDPRISIKQPKNFSAAFYNDYDGRIILKQADETYLRLSCCTKNDIGSDIRNIFENDEYRRIKYYFDSYKGHNFSLKFVEKFANCRDLLWEVNAFANYPLIKFEGHLIDKGQNHIMGKLTPDNKEDKNYGIIIVSKNQSGYSIEFCSDNIAEKLPSGFLEKHIDTETVYIPEPIKLCIDERREIESNDIFRLPEGKKEFLHIHAKPICRNDQKAAVVEICLSDSGNKNQEYETETDEFLQKNIIGSGIISCEMQNKMFFEDINIYLARLIREEKISKDALVNAHPFRSAISERLSSFGKFSFYNAKNEKMDYIMGAIPVIECGDAVRVFVFVISTGNRDIIDTSILNKLTPREGNVLRLVAEGFDNKHISQVLNITEGTAKRELFCCYKKLGVKNKIEIIRKLYHL